MFNNVVLDVFIGLIFIFLLYSLLATIIQEMFANFLGLRARMLHKGIRKMLEDGTGDLDFIKKFYKHPSIKYLAENRVFDKPAYLHAETFSKTIIHILRGEDYTNAKNQMQSIKAALDQNLHNIAPETLKYLNNLYVDAQHDIDKFKEYLEKWYDDTMDRVSGWYKRQTQWILMGIGLALAIIGNVDTIKIYRVLSKDKNAREQIVNMAIESQKKYAPAVERIRQGKDTGDKKEDSVEKEVVLVSSGDSLLDKTFKEVGSEAEQAGNVLGIGWHNSKNYKLYTVKMDSAGKQEKLLAALHKQMDSTRRLIDSARAKKDSTENQLAANLQVLTQDSLTTAKQLSLLKKGADDALGLCSDVYSGIASIAGWILLALAVSLGAPFWFDMLNKVVNLRNAGVKPPPASPQNVVAGETGSLNAKREGIRVIEKNG